MEANAGEFASDDNAGLDDKAYNKFCCCCNCCNCCCWYSTDNICCCCWICNTANVAGVILVKGEPGTIVGICWEIVFVGNDAVGVRDNDAILFELVGLPLGIRFKDVNNGDDLGVNVREFEREILLIPLNEGDTFAFSFTGAGDEDRELLLEDEELDSFVGRDFFLDTISSFGVFVLLLFDLSFDEFSKRLRAAVLRLYVLLLGVVLPLVLLRDNVELL